MTCYREKRAEVREYRKKKAAKKKERMNEIEEFREKEKGRWKDFSSKVSYYRVCIQYHSYTVQS